MTHDRAGAPGMLNGAMLPGLSRHGAVLAGIATRHSCTGDDCMSFERGVALKKLRSP